jgi:hypothetical protein
MLPRGVLEERSTLFRLLTVELPRVKPPGDCTLHLLFTLSDLFIIALWTNPPIPLVGDIGRSILSGEMRPWEGDIARLRVETGWSILPSDADIDPGWGNRCALVAGIGDTNPVRLVVEPYALLCVILSLVDELALEGEDDRSISACFVSLTSEL